ncbi:MAG TPA: ATP-binding protein [Candidatus Polarisedimenticolia bacterium]|nr:ATP-binding protein [Candidatus Polarisedimenticolia bacterium]
MKLPGFLRRSVRRKVTALVLATTLAALVITAFALVTYTVRDYRRSKVTDMRTQAEILGRASAPALAFDDRKEAVRDLAMLEARPDVDRAALYAADGSLFGAWARDADTSTTPSRAPDPGLRIAGDRLDLVYPIVDDGQRLGTVVLQARYGLRDRLFAYVVILLAVMAMALLAALLLSAWLQRAVTEPIQGVADAARRVVARRDFSVRAGRTTEDEIGMLADAMNHMLADLEREIRERRDAEEALRIVDRRKDEFLATLAHELRNPLAPIRNALYLMQAPGTDARINAEARAIIDRQVRQMVRLVDDLLEVSRITTGNLALRRERVDLRAVASAALEAVDPIVHERGHRLTADLPPAGLTIDADPTRLAQVFLNLLNNAAKFTPAGGHIAFSVEVKDGEMIGRVRDDGVGIAADMLDPIFEMFAQADRSLERTTSGLGVGLSLSRRLIELHGGRLEAHSDGPGKGSEFVVRLPVGPSPAPRPADRASWAEGAGGRDTTFRDRDPAHFHAPGEAKSRVLVVDDNRDFADTLSRMLRSLGHAVRVEYDGLAGLAAARTFRPDIAFLDIGMPGLNGYDLARRLRAFPSTSGIVLIAVTGWGKTDDRERSRDAGFDEHVVKPLEIERLQSILGRIG